MTFDPSKSNDKSRFEEDPEDVLANAMFIEVKQAGPSGRDLVRR
jgi:hypothetical protein